MENVTAPESRASRLLVVEDDATLARLMVHCLSKVGYEVSHVPDGRAAIDLIDREPPVDLVVLDFLMPYADGYRVLRTLRSTPAWEAVPVICVTGTSHEDTVIQGLRVRSDAFLTKPFHPEELVACVRQLLAT
ncbi:MAG: response regulator transcription factor [Chromatiales bacterium]